VAQHARCSTPTLHGPCNAYTPAPFLSSHAPLGAATLGCGRVSIFGCGCVPTLGLGCVPYPGPWLSVYPRGRRRGRRRRRGRPSTLQLGLLNVIARPGQCGSIRECPPQFADVLVVAHLLGLHAHMVRVASYRRAVGSVTIRVDRPEQPRFGLLTHSRQDPTCWPHTLARRRDDAAPSWPPPASECPSDRLQAWAWRCPLHRAQT